MKKCENLKGFKEFGEIIGQSATSLSLYVSPPNLFLSACYLFPPSIIWHIYMYSILNFAGLASSYSTLLPLFPMAATIQVILSQHNFTSPTVFSSISSFILFGSGLEQTLNLHNLVFFLLFPLIHHHAVCSGKLCNLRVNEECFEIALVFDYFLFPNWGVLYLETKSGDGYPALTFVCPRCCNPIGRK